MRYTGIAVSMVLVMFLAISCGNDDDDNDEMPTTGTISGTVTFVGEPPEGGGEVQVSIFSVLDENGRPTGPPAHYSEPFEQITGQVQYTIVGVSFGEYKLVAVGYEPPDSPVGTPEIPIGMYSTAPPVPGPITVSKEKPDLTGIDIMADYAQLEQ